MWKRYFRRSLTVGRAARTIIRSKEPYGNIELCCELEKTNPGLPSNAFVRLGSLAPAARACLRQRLITAIVYPYLLRDVMCGVANPNAPTPITAPAAWRRALASRGIHVRSDSAIRWPALLFLFWVHGIYVAFARARDVWKNRLPRVPGEPYAVLMNTTQNMIPRSTVGFDFVSWYLKSHARPSDVHEVWAHVVGKSVNSSATTSVTVTSRYLPALAGNQHKAQFVCALLWMILAGTARGLAGQWWEIAMLEQMVDLVYVRYLPKRDFARVYVFNNAWFILRPLWTYFAEEAGSRIDLVFYASNIELFDPEHRRVPNWPGYAGMTWQNYFVWDETQAQFIRDLGVIAPITIVGPTGFADSATVPQPFVKPYVVVFDVTPQRRLSLANRGIPHPYYNDQVWCDFMTQVQAALTQADFSLVYKKKREIGRIATAKSRRTIEQWSRRVDVITVDPEVAPQRLIRDAAGVISMPFTSTALIARSMGKPTIFYDPLGVLVMERRIAHDVEVVGSRNELDRWLANLPKMQMVSQPVS
jgi:polysaccharide biosynthesis PFTS motif protein